ncbi:MAG: alpha/beta fold hydrolase [Cyanobacteriota bacterium]|nr:alpha/beta fold hydrolase [Cyanobacteriota bacterium]
MLHFTIFESVLLKSFLILGGGIATVYIAACLFYLWGQNRFIFKPKADVVATPADFGLPYEELWLPVGGGNESRQKIHGWWCPQENREGEAGVVLYLHGSKGNMAAQEKSWNLDRVAKLYSLGFSVLTIDYRGYGRSDGPFPTEARVYEDAETAWSYLVGEKQVPPGKILVYGHSLGGAIAIHLCQQHPEGAGLVVESSLSGMKDAAKQRSYNIFPLDLLLHQEFDSINKIKSLEMPVLFIHGTSDRSVPVEMSQKLFEATSARKQLVLIPDAGHDDACKLGGDRLLATLKEFFNN